MQRLLRQLGHVIYAIRITPSLITFMDLERYISHPVLYPIKLQNSLYCSYRINFVSIDKASPCLI